MAVALSHSSRYRDIFIDGFVPPPSAAPMFPFFEKTTEWDDYGEVINPDDYMKMDDDMDHGIRHVCIFLCFCVIENKWIFVVVMVK